MTTTTISAELGKPRAFPYIRWSSPLQTGNSSKDRQSNPVAIFCDRHGLNEQEATIDEGKSARFGDHRTKGNLGRLLERVRAGDWILIEDLDRWSREDPFTAGMALRDVVFRDITVVNLTTGLIITKSNWGEFAVSMQNFIKSAIAHEENERKAKRCRDGWKALKDGAAKNIIMTETTPAWWKADKENNKFYPVEPHLTTIRRIFTEYVNGKGIRTIMRDLNGDEVPTFGRGKQSNGNGWSNTHLRRLLESRNVLGEYQPHRTFRDANGNKKREPEGPPVPNYYPQAIDPAIFYTVQKRLEKNGHPRGRKDRVTNLFTGLLKCSRCGGSIVIKRSPAQKGKYYYISLICHKGARGQSDCGFSTIQYPWVEKAVLTLLWSKVVPLMKDRDRSEDDLTAKRGELAHTEKALTVYMEKMNTPELASDTLLKHIASLETKERALRIEIESLAARVQDNPLAGWKPVPNTPPHRLRLQAILGQEIESITLDIKALKASIKVIEPQCQFDVEWERFQGDKMRSYGSTRFKCLDEMFPYVDELFVWESPKYDVRFELKEAA